MMTFLVFAASVIIFFVLIFYGNPRIFTDSIVIVEVLKQCTKIFRYLLEFKAILPTLSINLGSDKLKSSQILKLMKNGLDEEYKAILADSIFVWNQSGLTKKQIERREIRFVVGFYKGRFQNWIKTLKILSLLKVK